MATNYRGYDEKQYNNQSAYLNNLINNGTAGQKAWAQNEMNSLNSQYTGGSKPANTGGSKPSSSGTDYSGYNQAQYNNQSAYLNGLIQQGGGTGVWAQQELDSLNSQYKPTSAPTSTPTNTATSQPSNGAFISPGSQVADDGTRYHTWGENDQYTRKDYVSGNADLQYALEQYMKQQGNNVYDVDGYVNSLYNSIGTNRNDGSVITLADVDKELGRLGLSDYNSQNAIYTTSGKLLPNNQYVSYKDDNGETSNSADSRWVTYGGRDYLVGGDSANYASYVNGKTGNVDNLAMIFGNMANNPYAMQDPEFLMQYNQALNGFNNTAGIQNSVAQNTVTGNQNVDNVINYVNSLNGYLGATGGSYGGNTGGTGVNLLDMLQSYLNGGLEANQNFINQQRAYAEQQAQQQASDAYVNKVLAGDALKQQLSALGLGTSGAVQSAQMGVQGQYGNNLAQIQNNLAQMLNGLSEQELAVLSDYYNNMANYAYKVTNDEADRAYRNAQLALQQQQAQYDEAYRQQQLALQKQQYDWENNFAQQKYNDSVNANKQTGGNAYSPSKQGGVTYEDNNNLNLDIINPNNPQTGGEVTPQVNPEVQARWQGSMDSLENIDLPAALNLISNISSASQVQAPQAMNANQLAQLGMGAYNNATANMSAPASSYLNQTELQKKINEALALINNGGYSY